MKKVFLLILSLVLVLSGCSYSRTGNDSAHTKTQRGDYVKSVWVAYYELQKFIKDDELDFKNEIEKRFSQLKDMGFNTITVQVRPCADAFYKSSYFPSSKYCFGKQGVDMPYDPLKIMCAVAEKQDLSLEAWINPYRVSQDNDINKLCNTNFAKKWYKNKSKKRNVYVSKKAAYFNPASSDVNKLIVNGVKEIVENYSVSAIHFDDYFYPDTDKSIDNAEYQKYLKKGGKSSLSDWRRENVSNMIKSVYSAVKSVNKKVKFGISPASNIDNDYSSLYADVEKWSQDSGYIDYICPQIYFGFKNVKQPFMQTTKKWTNTAKCDLYIGLPLYKCSKPDEYAAKNDESVINEFKNNNDIIARQIRYIKNFDEIGGFYLFSYSCLFDENCKNEVENLLKEIRE